MLKLCSCYVARVFLSHLFIIPYFFDFKQVLRQALNLFFTRERRTEEWDLKDTTSSPSASSFESSKLCSIGHSLPVSSSKHFWALQGIFFLRVLPQGKTRSGRAAGKSVLQPFIHLPLPEVCRWQTCKK